MALWGTDSWKSKPRVINISRMDQTHQTSVANLKLSGANNTSISVCSCVYLRQVVDVCVIDNVQGINGSSEGVDLLMRISNQDFPTALRQEHIHDGWEEGREGGR